ncbi:MULTISPECIES: response regulator [unclassified Caulobacter]|uniref:response regulator n=1 Tax=unclassified Caulobacter TaxID=2648921 RepID=UPI0004A6F9D9|nr:response regulator [Caulobacter sp. UNC358MFTsu5.1]
MNAVALQKSTVLVVDDEFLVAEGLCMQVEDMNLSVCGTATNADEALALAMMFRPEVVLMDMRLRGEQDGVDAALAIHAEVGSKVIFITGSREQSTIDRIHQDHPAGLLFKPVSDRQLRMAIATALEE